MQESHVDLDITYHVADCADDSPRFYRAASWVVQQCGLQHLSASIAIVDDASIHRLNRQHLDHDWPTDVISFVFENQAGHVDGEIIASLDTARRVCLQTGGPESDELLLYVVHGLLHLAGLDDRQPEQRAVMRAHEQQCLQWLGVAGADEHIRRWEKIYY